MGVGSRALFIRRREATRAQWWKSGEGSWRAIPDREGRQTRRAQQRILFYKSMFNCPAQTGMY